MATAIDYRESALAHLPTISPLAMRLIGMLTRIDVDFREVTSIMEKDSVLCAQLLRAVNSASYARRTTIRRIGDAVMLLGASKLRKMALSATVINLFSRTRPADSWSNLRFNLHSAAVATFAEIVAWRLPVEHGELAFVAGLLHDMGKLAIAINLKREYDMILALRSTSGKPVHECEQEILGIDHAELSGLMMARWGLPEGLQRAVFYHHRPVAGDKIHLSRILNVADNFIHYLGIAVEPPLADPLPEFALEIEGIELPRAEILAMFETEYKELSRFFG